MLQSTFLDFGRRWSSQNTGPGEGRFLSQGVERRRRTRDRADRERLSLPLRSASNASYSAARRGSSDTESGIPATIRTRTLVILAERQGSFRNTGPGERPLPIAAMAMEERR
jgi:hypothetical protein